jgi:hypothetical protein
LGKSRKQELKMQILLVIDVPQAQCQKTAKKTKLSPKAAHKY